MISFRDPGAYKEEPSSRSYATDVRRLNFRPNAILPAGLEFQVFGLLGLHLSDTVALKHCWGRRLQTAERNEFSTHSVPC